MERNSNIETMSQLCEIFSKKVQITYKEWYIIPEDFNLKTSGLKHRNGHKILFPDHIVWKFTSKMERSSYIKTKYAETWKFQKSLQWLTKNDI